MPYYSDEIVEEVRSSSDIVDVISQYVNLQKKGSQYFGLCPFHNEKTGSFSVSPQKQMYYCFGCGAGGNVFSFLMNYENMTFMEAIESLASKAGITLPQTSMTNEEKAKVDKRSRIFEINKEAASFYYSILRSEMGKPALDYFKKRHLTEESMHKFGLGATTKYSDSLYKHLKAKGYKDELLKESGLFTFKENRGVYDKFWNRAMFPILDASGKVIGFGGRVMGDGEPKYLNSPDTIIFDKSRNLFGLYWARKSKRPQLICCEGYMDVISLHQSGFDNAVASLGTALTQGHANLIKRFSKDVYLSYDSDNAGQKATVRAIGILRSVGVNCKVIDMSPCKDPDEFMNKLGVEEYEKRIAEAENSFMYLVKTQQAQYDMSDPQKKSDFQKQVAYMLVTEFENQLERENYTESVADRFSIPLDALKKYMVELASQGGLVKQRKPEVMAEKRQAAKGDDGMKKSQRLMLTWLAEDPSLYEKIKEYISPEDFEEGIYHEVARLFFIQLQDTGKINPATIVDQFMEEADRQTVAQIFNTTIGEITDGTDRSKALKETLLRIKKNSLTRNTSAGSINNLVEEKKKLQRLERLNIQL